MISMLIEYAQTPYFCFLFVFAIFDFISYSHVYYCWFQFVSFFLISFIFIDTYWKRNIGDLQNIDIVYIFIRIDVFFFWVIRQLTNVSAISWRKQVNYQWDDDEILFVLDKHA
jgi:hypothetical protein